MKNNERIHCVNDKRLNKNSEYVLYWMQNAHRVDYNHALEFAIRRANLIDKPLVVVFVINPNYKEATKRHYKFMLEGLTEVKENLGGRGIKMFFVMGDFKENILEYSKRASFLVAEKGYLKHEREVRKEISNEVEIPMFEVETNLVVPVSVVSEKEEYAAYTFRPKIWKHVDQFSNDFNISEIMTKSLNLKFDNELNFDIDEILSTLDVFEDDFCSEFKGGIFNARKLLNKFIDDKLEHYEEKRNDPSLDYQSGLSPYLHFGQISPLEIYLKTKEQKNSEQFIEELIVRRELSFNFVYYNQNYDNYKCLPSWALDTLGEHQKDNRDYDYSLFELENYKTHDKYWNACQKEMVVTGKMHGYMRMYWGKKVIEWSSDYKKAFEVLIYLNNKYNIDGRGPNAYAGVAWCFGKHDRPWFEREIFGKVRYMNDKGLERKFDMTSYLKRWES